jgi:acyl-CoA thioesterase I
MMILWAWLTRLPWLIMLFNISFASPQKVLLLGDSISSAYGMSIEQGWVSLWQKKLQQVNAGVQVINASEAGLTTAGAKARLPRLLEKYSPGKLILALGGNDILQGRDAEIVFTNFSEMIVEADKVGCKVLLLGVRVFPNFGKVFQQSYEDMYRRLEKRYAILLEPAMLFGVGEHLALMQSDGIHPLPKAQEKILKHLTPKLEAFIAE